LDYRQSYMDTKVYPTRIYKDCNRSMWCSIRHLLRNERKTKLSMPPIYADIVAAVGVVRRTIAFDTSDVNEGVTDIKRQGFTSNSSLFMTVQCTMPGIQSDSRRVLRLQRTLSRFFIIILTSFQHLRRSQIFRSDCWLPIRSDEASYWFSPFADAAYIRSLLATRGHCLSYHTIPLGRIPEVVFNTAAPFRIGHTIWELPSRRLSREFALRM